MQLNNKYKVQIVLIKYDFLTYEFISVGELTHPFGGFVIVKTFKMLRQNFQSQFWVAYKKFGCACDKYAYKLL